MTPTSPAPPPDSHESPERPCDGVLCAADFTLLARPFAETVAFLFPEGLQVDFVERAATESAPDGDLHLILAPLDLPDGSRVTMRLCTEDGSLAAAVGDEWLALQAETAMRVLEAARPAWIDAETGFYNLRALGPALDAAGGGVFFLLQAGWGKKSLGEALRGAAGTAALLGQHTAGLGGALFTLGHGLFAVLLPPLHEAGLTQALKVARLLQRRLRQEGLTQGLMLHMGAASACRLFAQGGLAGFQEGLSAAGRQGPFGLVRADGADKRPPRFNFDEALCRAFKREWQSLERFSLALFRLEVPADAAFGKADCFDALRPVDPRTLALLLPGIPPEEAARQAAAVRENLLKKRPKAAVAVGIAAFPCLDYPKHQTPVNALKALLHADLLAREQGPGRLVTFDQLTLNVSGDAFFEDGDFHEALREYRRGLKLNPEDVNLLNSLGVTLAALGEEKRAAGSFRAALALEPDNHMALANLGYILLRDGRGGEALTCLRRALAAFPRENPAEPPPGELLRPLVQLLLNNNRFDEALDALERWAAALPVERDALYQRQLGLALKGAGRVEPALRAMERAMKLNPQDAVALGHLGDLYRLSGEGADLGLRFCRRAVRLNPEDAGLRRILGECLLACGNPDEAEEEARACLRLKADDGEGLWLLARVLIQKKNGREARILLNRALKLHTIGGDIKKRVARALEKTAKTAACRRKTPKRS